MCSLRSVPVRLLPVLLFALVLALGACRDTPAPDADEAATSKEAAFADSSAPAFTALTRSKTLATLTPGAAMSGRLTSGDPQLQDGSRFDVWTYEGRAGETLRLQLTSSDFDAYLIVAVRTPGGMETLARDDDSGSGTDAALSVRLPRDGTYHVVANSARAKEAGTYELHATSSSSEPATERTDPDLASGTRLSPDAPASGRLDASDDRLPDGSYFDPWYVEGNAGETVTITLRSSDFDAYLGMGLRQNGRFQPIAEDDDNGGGPQGTDARLRVELPESGTYTVLANTRYADERGTYTIALETDGAAADPDGGPTDPSRIAATSDAATAAPTADAIDYAARYPGGGDPSDRYAVLVGIDDYPGTDNDLPSSVLDVALMKETLVESMGFAEDNVVTITDQEATRDHVLNAVVRHLGQAGPDGTAVFYFSGHGIQLDRNAGITAPLDDEEDDVDEAFVLWGHTEAASLVLDDELGLITGQLDTDHALVILDACHSGTGTRGPASTDLPIKQVTLDEMGDRLAFPDDAAFLKSTADLRALGGAPSGEDPPAPSSSAGVSELLAQSRQHVLLSAARAEETALAGAGAEAKSTDVRASVFTHFLVEALQSAAPETTFEAMMEQVQQQVHGFTRARAGTAQTPQLEGGARTTSIHSFLRAK